MYKAYFDGGCGPVNPGGIASYGIVIYRNGKRVCSRSDIYTPPKGRETETTNNVAEYAGLLAVLDYFLDQGLTDEAIVVCGDSKLVIQQCFGVWEVKKEGRLYEALAIEARRKLRKFNNLKGKWIPREENTRADKLAKRRQIIGASRRQAASSKRRKARLERGINLCSL